MEVYKSVTRDSRLRKQGYLDLENRIIHKSNRIVVDDDFSALWCSILAEIEQIPVFYNEKRIKPLYNSIICLSNYISAIEMPYCVEIFDSEIINMCLELLKSKKDPKNDLQKASSHFLCSLLRGDLAYTRVLIENGFVEIAMRVLKEPVLSTYETKIAIIGTIVNILIEPEFQYLHSQFPTECGYNLIVCSRKPGDLKHPLRFIYIKCSINDLNPNDLEIVYSSLVYCMNLDQAENIEMIFTILWKLIERDAFNRECFDPDLFFSYVKSNYGKSIVRSLGFLTAFCLRFPSDVNKLGITIDEIIEMFDKDDSDVMFHVYECVDSYLMMNPALSNRSRVQELINESFNDENSFKIKSSICNIINHSIIEMNSESMGKLDLNSVLTFLFSQAENSKDNKILITTAYIHDQMLRDGSINLENLGIIQSIAQLGVWTGECESIAQNILSHNNT